MGCAAAKPEDGRRKSHDHPVPPRRRSSGGTSQDSRRRRLLLPSPPAAPAAQAASPRRPVDTAPLWDEGTDDGELRTEGSEHNATYGSLTDSACHPSPFGLAHDTGEGGATTPPEFALAVLKFRGEEPPRRPVEGATSGPSDVPAVPSGAHPYPSVSLAALPTPVPAEMEARPAPPDRRLPPYAVPLTGRSRQFLLDRFNQRLPGPCPPSANVHSIAGEGDQNLDHPLVPLIRSASSLSHSDRGSPSTALDEGDKATGSPHKPPSLGYLSIEPHPLWWKSRYGAGRGSLVERFRRFRDLRADDSSEPESPKSSAKQLVAEWLLGVEAADSESDLEDSFDEPHSSLAPTVRLPSIQPPSPAAQAL